MSLGRHRSVRQRELFDREDVPEHVPLIEAFDRKGHRREDRDDVEHAPIVWNSMASWVRRIGELSMADRASGPHRERFNATARTLTVDRIRECRHLDDLERAEKMLTQARYHDIGGRLSQAWPRRELGALLVELRNRVTLLRMGRSEPKMKGPRFDIERIPLDQLDRLIQRHPNVAMVEAMRTERNRRLGQ